jgi:2-polyprenyl-3-methyl-5-hydroxy-6-metoxy-1,4-benzoquinol methylase
VSPATDPRCLICGGTAAAWARSGSRVLVRCETCRFTWIPQGVKRGSDGRTIYESDTPVFAGDEQADYYRDEGAVEAASEKLAWVRRFVPRGAALLDVGANFGLFVTAAAGELDATGIEPSAAIVARARAAGAPLEVGSIDEADPRFEGRFDVVTLFDVIEHLSDPDAALRRCHGYLKPGGHLFITTPDLGSVMARVLGRHWYYVDFDEHVALFTRDHLRTVLGRTGFTVLAERTIGRRYRLSYIHRRLAFLGRESAALRAAAAAAAVLTVLPPWHLRINLGDVAGIVARRA